MIDSRPRVSAIIASYNYAPFLRDALDSVLRQTRPVDEIVLVDDGSTDATPAIAAEYPQVRYLPQANQGAPAARNRGVEETTGDLIAFLDGDDIWLPDKIERQLACFARDPNVGLVGGGKIWWEVDTGERRVFRYSERQRRRIKHEILFHNCVGNCSMTMIRRDIFNQVGGFDVDLRWGQDWELWIRIIERTKAAFIPEPIVVYRWHADNLSKTGTYLRATTLHEISKRAIRRVYPCWRRPLAYLRRFSLSQLALAELAAREGRRWRHLRHATIALLAWPIEKTPVKAKQLGRALMGEAHYRAIKRRWMSRRHRAYHA